MLIYSPTAIANYVRANRAVQTYTLAVCRKVAYAILETHKLPLPERIHNAHQLELERNVTAQVARGELVFVRQWIETPVTSDGHYLNFLSHLSQPRPVSNPPRQWDMFERRDDDLVLTAPEVAAWFGMRWWAEQN